MNRPTRKSSSAAYREALANYLGVPVGELKEGIDFNAKKAISALRKGETVTIDIILASKQTIKNVCSNIHLYLGYDFKIEHQDKQSTVTRVI